MRVFLSFLLALLFVSCSPTKPLVNEEQNKQHQEPSEQTTKTQKPLKLEDIQQKSEQEQKAQEEKQDIQIVSNMLRGVIYSQTYDPRIEKWIYILLVQDVANDAFKKKRFTHRERLCDPGDLVYAVFYRNNPYKLKTIYLIKKNYTNIIHRPKRTKDSKTPWIKPPKTEVLNLS